MAAADFPNQALTLLDASERRCAFLLDACEQLGRSDVQVVLGRAEELATTDAHRGQYALVTARSFGRPAVTAECALGFLRVGGALVVSDRVGDAALRWPPEGLDLLGFGDVEQFEQGTAVAAVAFRLHEVEGFPRRNGVPSKRPLW